VILGTGAIRGRVDRDDIRAKLVGKLSRIGRRIHGNNAGKVPSSGAEFGLEGQLRSAENVIAEGGEKTNSKGKPLIWFGNPPSRWQTVLWIMFTLGICMHFTLAYNAEPDFLDLNLYVKGMEKTPYQHRVLMMYVFRSLVTQHITLAILQHMRQMPHVPPAWLKPPKLVEICVVMTSIFGAVLATVGTLTKLTGDKIFSRWMSLLLIYMAYANLAPGWGLWYTFPYDTPSLMLFCVGVYLVVRERNWLYYLLYPIAVLNRETACFLTVFFVIWKWQELRTSHGVITRRDVLWLTAHGLTQATISIGLELWLAHLFAGNVYDYGSNSTRPVMVSRMILNLQQLQRPQQWPVLLSVFGFLLPVVWMQRRWIENPGIYWSCMILIPMWIVGMFIVGLLTEIRVFSELSALLVPALGLIIYHRFVPVPT
jgi:hypothetical protein